MMAQEFSMAVAAIGWAVTIGFMLIWLIQT